MRRTIAVLVALTLCGCAMRSAQEDGHVPLGTPDSEARRPGLPGRVGATLFAPDRVLAQAEAIGLTDDQKTALTEDVRRTQTEWDALATRLRTEETALVTALDRPRVDAEAAERAAAAVVHTEGELKAAHLALLVRVKNLLTEDQQRALAGRP